MKLIIINGPNLNLLGKREPEVYGSKTFEDYFVELQFKFKDAQLEYYQSNIEGELIDKIQEIGFSYDGIILNAASYTHTSVGIGDAVKAIETPVVEVHISNTHKREEFRQKSITAGASTGVITGFGPFGYHLALISLGQIISEVKAMEKARAEQTVQA